MTLIAGPTPLPTPVGARRLDVRTAQEMLEAVLAAIPQASALIMAAAVADFKPVAAAGQKIKKESGIPRIELQETSDILAAVAAFKSEKGWPRLTIGFAAESQDLLENARSKLQAKKLDFIAANDISATDAGFGAEDNRVSLLFPDGQVETLPLMNKAEVAEVILERIVALL